MRLLALRRDKMQLLAAILQWGPCPQGGFYAAKAANAVGYSRGNKTAASAPVVDASTVRGSALLHCRRPLRRRYGCSMRDPVGLPVVEFTLRYAAACGRTAMVAHLR